MGMYKDYIKSETDENGINWYWIEEPLFTFDYFEKSINERYNARLKHRTNNDLKKIFDFINEEIIDCKKHFIEKPAYNFSILSFSEKYTGDLWFSDETIGEFQSYLLAYSNYKYTGFMIDFLENKLKEPVIKLKLENDNAKYTIKQIALILVYEGKILNRENADKIIKEYGHNSGHKLYLEFNKVNKIKERISDPDISKKILLNKIKLFKSVAKILSIDLKAKVTDEINTLQSYLSRYK